MADLLRLVVCGSVDDGKSTLVGRLMLATDSILVDQWDALGAASARRGSADVDLALVTDGLRAEREAGITIDVAYRRFATPSRVFLVADCPGHVEYTRNTVTGASTADAALLLVDATRGVREQTRRHAAVLGLLGVPQVVVALNKMDAVADRDAVVRRLSAELADLAAATGLASLTVVPVSALTGDGIPDLLGVLDRLEPAVDRRDHPLRLPVQLAWGETVAGRVAAGSLSPGETVVDARTGEEYAVIAVDRIGAGEPGTAYAGESVTLTLDRPGVERGSLLVSLRSLGDREEMALRSCPSSVEETTARLCWLAEAPPPERLLAKAGTAVVEARVDAPTATFDIDALVWGAPRTPQANDLCEAVVRFAEPVVLDAYADCRPTGAFLLIDPDSGATVAAGLRTLAP